MAERRFRTGARRGLGLIELLVGVSIIGFLAVLFAQFARNTTRGVKMVADISSLARALSSLERDVMKDVPYLPAQEADSPLSDSPIFMDAEKAGTRCYDRNGIPALSCDDFELSPVLNFRVRFYKTLVRDQTFDPSSPLGLLPMSRVRFRVEYKVENKVQPPMFFARLQTAVLLY